MVTAVIAPAHIRSMAKPGTTAGQPGQDRRGAADGQALVAGLGGGGDGDLVDPLRRQLGVAAQQLADAPLTTRSSARVSRVHALVAGLAERGADAVDEDDVADARGRWSERVDAAPLLAARKLLGR